MTTVRPSLLRAIDISPFIRDLLLTMVTSLMTIAALVLVTGAAASGFGLEGFGAYMLSRRILATLDPLSTAAMGLALTRALARAKGDHGSLLLAGSILATVPALVCCGVLWGFSAYIATEFFHDAAYGPLVRATGAGVFTYSAYTVAYSWYRGTQRMSAANLLQLTLIAAGPLALAFLYARPGGEAPLVAGTAVLMGLAALPIANDMRRGLAGARIGEHLRALAAYGIPRIPGGLAFVGLLAVAPVMAAFGGSLRDVGFVAVGQAILRVVEGFTEAFGRVALPAISRIHASDSDDVLVQRVGDVVAAVLHIGLFATVQLWVFSPAITIAWLGEQYAEAGQVVQLVVIGVLPYLMFVTLRSVLDAIEHRPVNTLNLIASLVVAVAGSYLALTTGSGATGLAIASTAAFSLLGVLTVLAVRVRCQFSWRVLHLGAVLLLNAVGLLVALAANTWVSGQPQTVAMAAVVVLETLLVGAYAASLWMCQVHWMGEVWRRVIPK